MNWTINFVFLIFLRIFFYKIWRNTTKFVLNNTRSTVFFFKEYLENCRCDPARRTDIFRISLRFYRSILQVIVENWMELFLIKIGSWNIKWREVIIFANPTASDWLWHHASVVFGENQKAVLKTATFCGTGRSTRLPQSCSANNFVILSDSQPVIALQYIIKRIKTFGTNVFRLGISCKSNFSYQKFPNRV